MGAIVVGIFCTAVTAPAGGAANQTKTRVDAMELKQGDLGLGTEAFWDVLSDPRGTIDVTPLGDEWSGLYIDAPVKVLLEDKNELPLLIARKCSYKECYDLKLEEQSIAVAVQQGSNTVYAERAFYVKASREEPLQLSEEDFPKGTLTETKGVDLKARIPDFPLRPGSVAITLLLFDRRSNTVHTRLGKKEPKDPEINKFMDTFRKQVAIPPAKPVHPPEGSPFPHYRQTAGETPALPEGAGINLAVERVFLKLTPSSQVPVPADAIKVEQAQESKPRPVLVLRGSFRLPALAAEIVRPQEVTTAEVDGEEKSDSGTREEEATGEQIAEPKPTAVIGITLVLTGNEMPGPWKISLHVPSYDEIAPGEENPVVTGFFNVDLLTLDASIGFPQTFAIWAFSGKSVSDPVLTAIVTEEMLPRAGQ